MSQVQAAALVRQLGVPLPPPAGRVCGRARGGGLHAGAVRGALRSRLGRHVLLTLHRAADAPRVSVVFLFLFDTHVLGLQRFRACVSCSCCRHRATHPNLVTKHVSPNIVLQTSRPFFGTHMCIFRCPKVLSTCIWLCHMVYHFVVVAVLLCFF